MLCYLCNSDSSCKLCNVYVININCSFRCLDSDVVSSSLLSFLFSIPFFLKNDAIFCGKKVGSSQHVWFIVSLNSTDWRVITKILRNSFVSFKKKIS